jgi:tetratricopeptide (TPR) repeat protein
MFHPLGIPFLLLSSLLIPSNILAQSRTPNVNQVTQKIANGDNESALALLETMLKQKPTNLTLLRTQMNLLLGMRRNWKAMLAAEALRRALPEGLEKESLRSFAELARKTRGELQKLIEQAILLRESRNPKKLLQVWKKLDKLRPEDPLVHFGMGVVYGSYGREFNANRALWAFKKFLTLTSDEQFQVGSIYTPSELASSLRKFSTFGKESDLPGVRMQVHSFIKQLKEKKPLYQMTPLTTISRMEEKYEGELRKHKREIAKAQDSIARCQRYLDKYTPSRKHDLHTNKRRKIRQLERLISLKKKKITVLTLVLRRLRSSHQ